MCPAASMPAQVRDDTAWSSDAAKSFLTLPQSFGVPGCADCPDPFFSAAEFTSQCTDQCVVIACNDPNHGESNCKGNDGNGHCDLVCNGGLNCTDQCTDFDALCCSCPQRSHMQLCHTIHPPDTQLSWDQSIDEFLCACGQSTPQTFASPYSPSCSPLVSGIPYASLQAPTSLDPIPSDILSQMDVSDIDSRSRTGSCTPLLTPEPSVLLPSEQPPVACMWGDCNASFDTLAQLADHVHLAHLTVDPSLPSPDGLLVGPGPEHTSLTCLWKNCSVPAAMPPPSENQIEEVLGFLANHLFHDHLGISSVPVSAGFNTGYETTLMSHSDAVVRSLSSSPSSSGPPAPPEQQCTTVHKCFWQSCGRTFENCDELTAHLTADHVGGGKAHYECFWEGCTRNGSNGFSSKQKICRHLQSHTGHRPFQCEICHQNFSEAATLQQHMRRHTREKPYVCDHPGCGKSFAIAGALTIHKRIHNGHKPFSCPYCDRAFTESSNLSKHLRTHTGIRPYVCPEPGCGKAFARPDQLSRHRNVHARRCHQAEI